MSKSFEGNYDAVKDLARVCLKAGESVVVKGGPGVGKSSMAYELSKEFGLDMEELRLGQMEPSDLAGMPFPNKETGTVEWYRPYWVPVDKPKFIFLDEFNAGVTKLHQAAAYQIVLDKRVGQFRFAEGTMVMAAGNREEDNAIVVPISSAFNNRFAGHYNLNVDAKLWLEWAESKGFPAEFLAFVAFKREKALYNNDGSEAFPSPRSMAKAAVIIKGIEDRTMISRLMSGCVGAGMAMEYIAYLDVYSKVDLKDIFQNGNIPANLRSEKPDFLYALVYAGVSYLVSLGTVKVNGKVAENTVALLSQMSKLPELQTLFLKLIVKYNKLLDSIRVAPGFDKIAGKLTEILRQA